MQVFDKLCKLTDAVVVEQALAKVFVVGVDKKTIAVDLLNEIWSVTKRIEGNAELLLGENCGLHLARRAPFFHRRGEAASEVGVGPRVESGEATFHVIRVAFGGEQGLIRSPSTYQESLHASLPQFQGRFAQSTKVA